MLNSSPTEIEVFSKNIRRRHDNDGERVIPAGF